MNGLERITAAVRFQMPDCVPVMPQIFGHAAVLAGVDLGDYVCDGALLARCQMEALARYEHDVVFAVMDVGVETEALGSTLTYYAHQYPEVQTYALVAGVDPATLSIPDPRRAGRMPELLKAIRILRRDVGGEVLVTGCVVGPMTLVTQILGVENALYLAVDDTGQFARLLDFATEVILRFGIAQIEAGAHVPVVFEPAASPDVIPPQFFRDYALPRVTRILEAFKSAGAAFNWLHITGPVLPILQFYPQAGVDLANIDYCVDPREAAQVLPNTCLTGNLKPLAFVEAAPEVIAGSAARLLAAFAGRGGFILSSGCEIPPEAQPANVAALVRAVRGGCT